MVSLKLLTHLVLSYLSGGRNHVQPIRRRRRRLRDEYVYRPVHEGTACRMLYTLPPKKITQTVIFFFYSVKGCQRDHPVHFGQLAFFEITTFTNN